MLRKLTVELTAEEIHEAIKNYVRMRTNDTPTEVLLTASRLNEFTCIVHCFADQEFWPDKEPPNENAKSEEETTTVVEIGEGLEIKDEQA